MQLYLHVIKLGVVYSKHGMITGGGLLIDGAAKNTCGGPIDKHVIDK